MLDVEEVWEDVSFASEGEEKSTSYTTAAGSVSHKLHMQITGDCVCSETIHIQSYIQSQLCRVKSAADSGGELCSRPPLTTAALRSGLTYSCAHTHTSEVCGGTSVYHKGGVTS